jgi:hypothetical protein
LAKKSLKVDRCELFIGKGKKNNTKNLSISTSIEIASSLIVSNHEVLILFESYIFVFKPIRNVRSRNSL